MSEKLREDLERNFATALVNCSPVLSGTGLLWYNRQVARTYCARAVAARQRGGPKERWAQTLLGLVDVVCRRWVSETDYDR